MFAFFKASMRSGVGIIAFYCAIAAVAFLLQWFPISGIFLMIFGGLLVALLILLPRGIVPAIAARFPRPEAATHE